MARFADELLADFQQYYSLDLWEMRLDTDDCTREVLRASALARQLPPESRLKQSLLPDSHSLEVQLLREIEYNQRLWHWANTEEAKKKDTAPQRMLLPGEEDAYENAVADAEREAIRMADRLGIKL